VNKELGEIIHRYLGTLQQISSYSSFVFNATEAKEIKYKLGNFIDACASIERYLASFGFNKDRVPLDLIIKFQQKMPILVSFDNDLLSYELSVKKAYALIMLSIEAIWYLQEQLNTENGEAKFEKNMRENSSEVIYNLHFLIDKPIANFEIPHLCKSMLKHELNQDVAKAVNLDKNCVELKIVLDCI
jgi:hypothetical protein